MIGDLGFGPLAKCGNEPCRYARWTADSFLFLVRGRPAGFAPVSGFEMLSRGIKHKVFCHTTGCRVKGFDLLGGGINLDVFRGPVGVLSVMRSAMSGGVILDAFSGHPVRVPSVHDFAISGGGIQLDVFREPMAAVAPVNFSMAEGPVNGADPSGGGISLAGSFCKIAVESVNGLEPSGGIIRGGPYGPKVGVHRDFAADLSGVGAIQDACSVSRWIYCVLDSGLSGGGVILCVSCGPIGELSKLTVIDGRSRIVVIPHPAGWVVPPSLFPDVDIHED